MKIKIYHILYIVFLLALMAGCAHNNAQTVIAIEETHSYHLPTCAKVSMAKAVMMPRDEAIRRQLHPCPYCKPDKSI